MKLSQMRASNFHKLLRRADIRAVTFYPNLAVRINFFLPDRHGSLEFADQPFARGERGFAMGRRNGDDDTCFTDLELTEPVDDTHV